MNRAATPALGDNPLWYQEAIIYELHVKAFFDADNDGIDGLRLDAIPCLCERDGTSNENLPETHEVIRQMRAVIDAHYRGRMFLAEANPWQEAVNVEAQERKPSCILNTVKRLIAARKRYAALGRGSVTFLQPGNRKILAYVREYRSETILCVANLSRAPLAVELDLARYRGRVPVELSAGTPFPPVGEPPYLLTLPAHGRYFFRLAEDVDVPSWHDEPAPRTALPVLVLPEGLKSLFGKADAATAARRLMSARTHEQLSREVLAPYIESKRWYAAKGRPIESIERTAEGEWRTPYGCWLLATFEVKPAGTESQSYFLPLGVAWVQDGEDKMRALGAWTLARVRQRAQEGILYGAFGSPDFCRAIVSAMASNEHTPLGDGYVRFVSTSAFSRLCPDLAAAEVRHPALEQSNTAVYVGASLFLKGYRRIRSGVNPELEMGRFLTEVARFPHIVPVAGAMQFEHRDGRVDTLVLLQAYVENQGDAWHHAIEYLTRIFNDCRIAGTSARVPPEELHAAILAGTATLGRRVGELHRALAIECDDPAFRPEPVTGADLKAWAASVTAEVNLTIGLLRDRDRDLSDAQRAMVARLALLGPALLASIEAATRVAPEFTKTRFHGDLHLGQILLAGNDFVITDFEGEPARSYEERRAKHSPLKDVAGMLRSFNYAGFGALQHAAEGRPNEFDALLPAVSEWEKLAADTFLRAYLATAAHISSIPKDERDFRALLDLFLIEKALYEVRYELNNRPKWLDLPLRGLLMLLEPRTNGPE